MARGLTWQDTNLLRLCALSPIGLEPCSYAVTALNTICIALHNLRHNIPLLGFTKWNIKVNLLYNGTHLALNDDDGKMGSLLWIWDVFFSPVTSNNTSIKIENTPSKASIYSRIKEICSYELLSLFPHNFVCACVLFFKWRFMSAVYSLHSTVISSFSVCMELIFLPPHKEKKTPKTLR